MRYRGRAWDKIPTFRSSGGPGILCQEGLFPTLSDLFLGISQAKDFVLNSSSASDCFIIRFSTHIQGTNFNSSLLYEQSRRRTQTPMTTSSMSPKQEEGESPDIRDSSIKSEDESGPSAVADAARKHAARRRTKTGCLSKFALPSTHYMAIMC